MDISTESALDETVLYGPNNTENIVAIEANVKGGAQLFIRHTEGVSIENADFRPWILIKDQPNFSMPEYQLTELNGEGYRLLIDFTTMAECQEARTRLKEEHISYISPFNSARMALTRSGQTLFKSMNFEEIVRLQFDLETEGLNPVIPENRILLIAVSDSLGLVTTIDGTEQEILEQFVSLIIERDPDVLEGHNLLGFDLPYLMERARQRGVKLGIGRDGSEPSIGMTRNYAIGGATRPFRPVHIYGRHVVDTYLVVQRFDWARQALSSYGLKECARALGISEEDRVELPRDQMKRLMQEQPDLVKLYARQDVLETDRLAALITPVEFYQAQMVPDNYGQTITAGSGEKIDSILIRAYLQAGQAIPETSPSSSAEGGYVEVREKGLLRRVVKADVESLYPSLMLTHKIAPASDTLGVFLPALKALTIKRLDAKKRSAAAQSPADFSYWDGMQNSFKVLINSFYGYLGSTFHFSDNRAAAKVTALGRELVQKVAEEMSREGSRIIEIDTDGIYFVPPDRVAGEKAEREYIEKIARNLPAGIRLSFDGRYAAMLSLKTKNYALETYEGKRILRGASLRSRADEPYGRKFLEDSISLLLEGDKESLSALYASRIAALVSNQVPIQELARRERVTEKTFQSGQKARSAAVAKGVAIGDFLRIYERSDGTLGRVEEYSGDENIPYYLDKLYKFACRLEEAFENKSEFDSLLPRPTPYGLPRNLQISLDL